MTTEKLIQTVLSVGVETGSLVCLGCGHEHNCGIHGCAILREAAACIEALTQTMTAEDSRQILHNQIALLERDNEALVAQLTERDKQLGAAVEKAKLWGADLIEANSDARVTICAECGYPIADYGVDKEIHCSWCKAKNTSAAYAPEGPGYCKTTLDRKSKTFDKLFQGGRGAQAAGEGAG